MRRKLAIAAGLVLLAACSTVAVVPEREPDGDAGPDGSTQADATSDAALEDAAVDAAPDGDASVDADADAATDPVVQVASGRRRTCFLYASGRVTCVGENTNGEDGQGPPPGGTTPSYQPKLGDGLAKHVPSPCNGIGVDCTHVPVTVVGLSDAVEVAAGDTVTCARRLAGSVVCWGQNERGQIGDGTLTHRPLATAVAGLVDAVQITVGKRAACARRATGGVVCWGSNEYGSLGDGTVEDRSSPVAVSGLTDAIDVSLSEWGACAVRSGGTAVCWGLNKDGNLGDGVDVHETCPITNLGGGPHDCSKTPVEVVGVTGATAVSRSTFHACIMRANGTMSCWGDGVHGKLGDGLSMNSSVPVDVLNMTNAAEIRAAQSNTCARRTTGQVACWGSSVGLPLGSGTRATPNDIPGLTDATRISSGYSSSDRNQCAIRPMGRVSCWGTNNYGELSNGTMTTAYEPTDVAWK